MAKITKEAALLYHSQGKPGKIEVVPTKPYSTQTDLSLAYSPGVAEPCLEIEKNPQDAYKYTAKGNLVAVISNGTAVLGLGDIGALSGKPVMEGKGLLFKIYAGIDVFDIEVDEKDPEKFIAAVKAIAPTFGGINLEDIRAPECFYIERKLREKMNIPVFHDDQHGTAVIVGAAVLNALKVVGKNIKNCKMVVSGAGAGAMGCLELLVDLGFPVENIWVTDIKGVVYKGRKELMDPEKEKYAQETDARTLMDVISDADIFLGLSAGNVLKPEMVLKMAKDPVIFAMANPIPEILPEVAHATRDDVIMGTGRSDYPNQINNSMCFPYLFRGALDCRAKTINREMELAAVRAIASLAEMECPEEIVAMYGKKYTFGRDYLLPFQFDPRLLWVVAPAVAQAAMDSGVARVQIADMDAYRAKLKEFVG